MGFLNSVKSFFATDSDGNYEKGGYWIYVRCNRCGEVIKTRLDLQHNLYPRDEGGYIARKTLVGNQLCFERIEVTLIFDAQQRVVEKDIAQGQFITAEEFNEAKT